MDNVDHIDRENIEKAKQTANLLVQDLRALMKTKDTELLDAITPLLSTSHELEIQLEKLCSQTLTT